MIKVVNHLHLEITCLTHTCVLHRTLYCSKTLTQQYSKPTKQLMLDTSIIWCKQPGAGKLLRKRLRL